MSLSNKLLAPTVAGGDIPEGVSFDGSTDYLSRSVGLVGNVDSKTFTFSCWVYWNGVAATIYNLPRFRVFINSDNKLWIMGLDASNGNICVGYANVLFPKNTWTHVSVSADTASTTKRHITINDTNVSTSWNYYVNSTIAFTLSGGGVVGAYAAKLDMLKGRLSNVFLDYTYRDLSIEANRRLFITADGKPAEGLELLNPIIYLPMKDASTAHINLGTGGDFVQNGILATADRGPNQDNCVASMFDGVDDYLSIPSLTGALDGKQFTFSCTIKPQIGINSVFACEGLPEQFIVRFTNNMVSLKGYTTDWQDKFNITYSNINIVANTLYHMSVSFDLTDVNKTKLLINGVLVTPTTNTSANQNLNISSKVMHIGKENRSEIQYTRGDIGELYFDTNYIDLAINNPFWDSETNKPIPVRKAMEILGSNPLVCMPIDASNPTKNYGSGGDFTLNGGGLTGARGMSEHITRRILNYTSTDYLSKMAIGPSGLTKVTMMFMNYYTSMNGPIYLLFKNGAGGIEFYIDHTIGHAHIKCYNASNTLVLYVETATYILSGNRLYLVSFDLSDTLKRHLFVNGATDSETWRTYNTTGSIDLSQSVHRIGYATAANQRILSGCCYLANEYIDFSQEANRNLFVNQLGYPRDLREEIEAGTIPTPLIYLPFDDPTNLGKNLGTGGDFTINGTVTQGADFAF